MFNPSMSYRRTEKMAARLAEKRERIVITAMRHIAHNGYASATMPAIAEEAGVSTGLIYKYFQSKTELFDEVFQRVSQREIDACAAAAASLVCASAHERLGLVIDTFVRRALKGKRLAWALLAEPADPIIVADRTRFRAPFRAIFAEIVRTGVHNGEIAPQDANAVAAAIVGAIAESILGSLNEQTQLGAEEALITTVKSFCVQALGRNPNE
jgi:AcrR family transcriptional regulator